MSSASRPSASVVKPTRSANRIETRRSSAIGAALAVPAVRKAGWAVADGVAAATAPTTSGVAHSPQNFEVEAFAAPQDGQTAANRVAHSPQNLRPASFSVPQLEQINQGS